MICVSLIDSFKLPASFYLEKKIKINMSNLENITTVLTDINTLLPQLSNFIHQFNNLIVETGVNVITDSTGNMSIDVPKNMPDIEAENISKRIGIIDRLITNHGNSINDLFQKGLSIEDKLKKENPEYSSQLTAKIQEFKKLNVSYKH